MDTHFAVLPLDVIDTVVSRLADEAPRSSYFLRLPHPRTNIASLFLVHESVPDEDEPDQKCVSKILEVQAVEPPNARSWFMGDEVMSDGKLLVMTPVDPLFLLIPILGAIKQADGGIGNFRPAEDMFEDAARHVAEASKTGAKQDTSVTVGVEDVIKFSALGCTRRAMRRLCDVKEITSEITVFRYSREKLVQELRKKVAILSTPCVTEMSRCLVRRLAKDGLMDDNNEDLLELGRTKLACELLGQYLAPDVQQTLVGSYDLARLDAHVRALAGGPSVLAPEGNADAKKRRGGTEKKRKTESRDARGAKRANVRGMAKLSTFFAKKVE